MTERKPDFWIVKRDGIDGVTEYLTHEDPEVCWSYDITVRTRFITRDDAERYSRGGPYKGPLSVVPVYCTTRKAEPQTRSRSSAWVLRRLAEGKVIYREQSYGWRAGFLRLNAVRCCVEWRTKGDCGTWVAVSGALSCSGRLFCRIAKPEEIPS